MITLYSGIPGSGKSYKMVHDLLLIAKNYYVVHNIDGLREEVVSQGIHFVKYCEENNIEVIDFFSKEYQIDFTEKVREKYGKDCLVVIDEAHEWFDKNKKPLKMWLSYHRHLNQTIWLVAHRSTNIPSVYRSYIEEEYRAKSSSIICLPGYFMYNRIVAGESCGFKFVKKKNEVFEAYKSQTAKFKKKKASMVIPVMMLFVIFGVVAFLSLPKLIAKNKEEPKMVSKEEAKSVSMLKKAESEEEMYRYAGNIKNEIILQNVNTKQYVRLSEMPHKYMLEHRGKEFVRLYDIRRKKLIVVESAVEKQVVPTAAESAQPVQVQESGKK